MMQSVWQRLPSGVPLMRMLVPTLKHWVCFLNSLPCLFFLSRPQCCPPLPSPHPRREVMDSGLMDVVFNLHHDCMRRTGRRWRAYETQTAGDSFTLAFHTATDAVNFCMDLQVRADPWVCSALPHHQLLGLIATMLLPTPHGTGLHA